MFPMQHPPTTLVLVTSRFWMDGGTIELVGIDEKGQERTISLIQSAFKDSRLSDIPGRLYLDEHPVPDRSELEKQVIAILHME